MTDSITPCRIMIVLSCSLLLAACGSLRGLSSLQGASIELKTMPGSELRSSLLRQSRQQGAVVVASGQHADIKLKIDSEQCEQLPDLISGTDARVASYELRCHIRFTIDDGNKVTSDYLSVRDSLLYDDVGSDTAQFPGRDNELKLLRETLVDEAAVAVLQQVSAILAVAASE